ncbi:MAG: diguanylate cyclase [Gammaproteobacteria bacterium]
MTTWRFWTRLLGALALLQALVFSLLLWNIAHERQQERFAAQQRHAQTVADLLAQAAAALLAPNQRAQLLDNLTRLSTDPGLRYTAIYNASQTLVASTGAPAALGQEAFGAIQARDTLDAGVLNVERPIVRDGRTVGVAQIGYAVDSALKPGALFNLNTALALLGLALSLLLVAYLTRAVERRSNSLTDALQALRKGQSRIVGDDDWDDSLGPLAHDIDHLASEQHAAKAEALELRNELNRYLASSRSLAQAIHAVSWTAVPGKNALTQVSDDAEKLLGFSTDRWLSPGFFPSVIHDKDRAWVEDLFSHPGFVGEHLSMDLRARNAAGDQRWLRMVCVAEERPEGAIWTGWLFDISDEKRSEQRIAFLTDHDLLTEVLNRQRFQERLQNQLKQNLNKGTVGALLSLDLDQVRFVNGACGYDGGDEYLRQAAKNLRSILGETVVIGRLGGDSFGLILADASAESAAKTCQSLLVSLGVREFSYANHRLPFSASIGVTLFPTHGEEVVSLLAQADAAMFVAKDFGGNAYHLYERGGEVVDVQEALRWVERIRRAFQEQRFKLFYQPIIDIQNGAIRHYEVLLRMVGEEGETILPDAFRGVAEHFGLIDELDRWVISQAVRIQGNSVSSRRPLILSLNLSGRHFNDPTILDFIQEEAKVPWRSPT